MPRTCRLLTLIPTLFLTAVYLFAHLAHAGEFSFGCDLMLKHPIKTPSYGLQIAAFESGTLDIGNSQIEAELRHAGKDLISIENPSAAEIAAGQAAGYLLAPHEVSWTGNISTILHFLRISKSEQRAIYEEKLWPSADRVRVDIGPLTVSDFRKWHNIYLKEVVEPQRSRRKLKASWAKKQGDGLGKYQRLFLYDERTGKLLGGAILNVSDEHYLRAEYEAYKAEAKDLNLEVRAFSNMLDYGFSHGFKTIIYGLDSNLYGHYLPVSNLESKSLLGLNVFRLMKYHLVKILNRNILNRDYLILAIEGDNFVAHHFTDKPRDLHTIYPINEVVVHDLRADPLLREPSGRSSFVQ